MNLNSIFRIITHREALIALLPTFFLITNGFSQSVKVEGYVSNSDNPVQNALVAFIDQAEPTKTYTAITDINGLFQLSVLTQVEPYQPNHPKTIELAQNYPNPFTTDTAIPYQVNKNTNSKSAIRITVFDILGREVKRFNSVSQNPGMHTLHWDGTTTSGISVAKGIYFCRLESWVESQVKKMVFMGKSGAVAFPIAKSQKFSEPALTGKQSLLLTQREFLVQIENTTGTKPKIRPLQLTNVSIKQDTTINFDVQPGFMVYSLCYQKWDSITISGKWYQDWDIYLNNLSGTIPNNITNWLYDNDETPKWSPDGGFICFIRNEDLYLYNCLADSYYKLAGSDSVSFSIPFWTPNSKKIIYQYHAFRPNGIETHIMNFDGTNDEKLSHRPAYFFSDSFSYIYIDDSLKIFKANLNNSVNEFIFDLKKAGGFLLQDFNPNTNEILFSTKTNENWAIETFNIETLHRKVIFSGDSSYSFSRLKWSKDYSKIVIIELKVWVPGSVHDEYLSVLENNIKQRIVHISENERIGGFSCFSYFNPEFSPDNNYIVFGKLFMTSGLGLILYKDVFLLDLNSGIIQFIDRGDEFSWNPIYINHKK